MQRKPLPGSFIIPVDGDERQIYPGPGWLADIDPRAQLTFAGYRPDSGSLLFCLVLSVDPDKDQLVLLPLPGGKSPLHILTDPDLYAEMKKNVASWTTGEQRDRGSAPTIRLSFSRAIVEKRLGPPLPKPKHVYAVAANYPSHLTHDLAVDDVAEKRSILTQARPRIFLKFPPTPPPGIPGAKAEPFSQLLGPFDDLYFPEKTALPGEGGGKPRHEEPTHLDYEVEIGVVLGRSLSWEEVGKATDAELRAAVAGYLLVSDAKARDPQVVQKVINEDLEPDENNPYLIGDTAIDAALGIWDAETCLWWSHAAGWGRYTSVGPFLVTAPPDDPFPSRAMVSARSYGKNPMRGYSPPRGRKTDTLYLRQATLTTEDRARPDALIWTVPQILRSILNPEGNALAFMGESPRLEAGDIVSLGTPGGTVITGKPWWVFSILENLLFWKEPIDWHHLFFDREAGKYLLPGDRLFLWAEGLGYQRLEVRRLPEKTDAETK